MGKNTNVRQASPQGRVDRIEERSTPETPVIYEIVRRMGKDEMSRPGVSLWWSGFAAGLSISFSLLAEAILWMHLPEAGWRPLVASLGYPVGFLMVVLGRQQLFTETTITVVLPVLAEPTRAHFQDAGRMWLIVLLANLAGTLMAALFCSFVPVVDAGTLSAMLEVSRNGMGRDAPDMFFRAITSGFLMAAMVWLIPAAGIAQFRVIYLITYLIGVGGFAHIVSGSVYAFMLVAQGEMGVLQMLGQFTLPVLAGNIVGGTVLFALLSHAQVMKEI